MQGPKGVSGAAAQEPRAGAGKPRQELPEKLREKLEGDAATAAAAGAHQLAAPPPLTPAATAAPAPPPAADPALIRQVAQKVLTGIEVHLAAGRSRVDLGLDLGKLGQAQVELARTRGGPVQITFRADSGEGQLALASGLPDLVQSLEARGIDVGRVELQGERGAVWSRGADEGRGGSDRQPGQPGGEGRSRGRFTAEPEEDQGGG